MFQTLSWGNTEVYECERWVFRPISEAFKKSASSYVCSIISLTSDEAAFLLKRRELFILGNVISVKGAFLSQFPWKRKRNQLNLIMKFIDTSGKAIWVFHEWIVKMTSFIYLFWRVRDTWGPLDLNSIARLKVSTFWPVLKACAYDLWSGWQGVHLKNKPRNWFK